MKLVAKLITLSVLTAMPFVQAATDFPILPLQPLLNNVDEQYPILKSVLSQPKRYHLQLLYTQVDRDSHNRPSLITFQYGVDDALYFYPASTVKLPIAALALEWLNEQNNPALTSATVMLTDASDVSQTSQWQDTTADTGLPSIAHYIKKILLVSDNDASNRLYELLGQDYINQRLAEKGLLNTTINHRLSVPLTEQQNRQVNPIRFVDSAGKIITAIPERTATNLYVNAGHPQLGKGYISDGKLIETPMDFSNKNRLSLTDLDGVVKRLIFPQLFPATQQFRMADNDRELMLRYMAMLPPQSISPQYDPTEYPENYSKFLMFGGPAHALPADIRIFNKTGWAYGHIIDSAYIVDLKHQVEFFVSAVIYTNENDILNDDIYQTDEIALPFLNQLGNFLYQYELNRSRKQLPDLSSVSRITEKPSINGQ